MDLTLGAQKDPEVLTLALSDWLDTLFDVHNNMLSGSPSDASAARA